MKTRSLFISLGLIVGALVIAIIMVRLRPDPPQRAVQSATPFVTTLPIVPGSGPIPIHGAGTVRPMAEIDVAAQVSGLISWVNPAFQSGGRIRVGGVLFRIDDADFRNRVQQARAMVAAQQVALLQAQEEARIARSEFERFNARESRRSGMVEGASPLTLREPQLAAARAALARDSASLADAELALSRTTIRAPFSGVVRSELVALGQFVAAGQGVGRFYAADVVEVVVPLADEAAALIPGLWDLRAGDANRGVRGRVIGEFSGNRFEWEGYVDRADAALDEQTRTIDIVIRVDDPFGSGRPVLSREPIDANSVGVTTAPPLLVGQFVDVVVDGAVSNDFFIAPRRALQTGNIFWAIRADTLVTIVPVTVLQRSEEAVFVTGALRSINDVVVSGLSVATEGMTVRRRSPAAAAPTRSGVQ